MPRATLAAALAAAALLGAPAASADAPAAEREVCFDTRVLIDFRAPYFDGCAAVYEDHYGGTCAKVYGDFNGQHRRFGCVE
jgi:ABC-type sugar transport system substrate-binding protein